MCGKTTQFLMHQLFGAVSGFCLFASGGRGAVAGCSRPRATLCVCRIQLEGNGAGRDAVWGCRSACRRRNMDGSMARTVAGTRLLGRLLQQAWCWTCSLGRHRSASQPKGQWGWPGDVASPTLCTSQMPGSKGVDRCFWLSSHTPSECLGPNTQVDMVTGRTVGGAELCRPAASLRRRDGFGRMRAPSADKVSRARRQATSTSPHTPRHLIPQCLGASRMSLPNTK